MDTRMACQQCGVMVTAGARFCANCGADVSAEQGNVATRRFTSTQAMHDRLLERVRHAALGEYEILTELGRGGMATVYLAHDIQLDRKVALKVMLPAMLEGEDMVERFRLEARTAAQLSHPHIIPIYAVRTAEQLVYFVMKFVEGRPLDAIIKEVGQLPVPMVRSILSKVGEALGYAHRRGVVHRDIKPANLMIDVEGLPVVTDFGIAKVADTRGLTMTGAMMGTPTYMSPEQCSAREITGASDQYSLGVVAYQMLGGRVPFEGDTVVSLLYKHVHEPPPPLLAARPDCPPALATAVMRMLAKDPGDRFPSMEAAVEAIGSVTLAFDDPVRTQLIGLARRGENVSALKRISTPQSPIPRRTKPMDVVADGTPAPAALHGSSASHAPAGDGLSAGTPWRARWRCCLVARPGCAPGNALRTLPGAPSRTVGSRASGLHHRRRRRSSRRRTRMAGQGRSARRDGSAGSASPHPGPAAADDHRGRGRRTGPHRGTAVVRDGGRDRGAPGGGRGRERRHARGPSDPLDERGRGARDRHAGGPRHRALARHGHAHRARGCRLAVAHAGDPAGARCVGVALARSRRARGRIVVAAHGHPARRGRQVRCQRRELAHRRSPRRDRRRWRRHRRGRGQHGHHRLGGRPGEQRDRAGLRSRGGRAAPRSTDSAVSAEPAPVAPREAIDAAIQRYARALETKQLSEVRAAIPRVSRRSRRRTSRGRCARSISCASRCRIGSLNVVGDRGHRRGRPASTSSTAPRTAAPSASPRASPPLSPEGPSGWQIRSIR
jgi:serine/threonine protein kinase